MEPNRTVKAVVQNKGGAILSTPAGVPKIHHRAENSTQADEAGEATTDVQSSANMEASLRVVREGPDGLAKREAAHWITVVKGGPEVAAGGQRGLGQDLGAEVECSQGEAGAAGGRGCSSGDSCEGGGESWVAEEEGAERRRATAEETESNAAEEKEGTASEGGPKRHTANQVAQQVVSEVDLATRA